MALGGGFGDGWSLLGWRGFAGVGNVVHAMDGLTVHLLSWEDKGWIRTVNSKWFQAATYHLCRCSTEMVFKWVKGHAGSLGNEQADALANAGAHKLTPNEIDTTVLPNFNLNGAKLATLTQALAHKAILDKRPPHTKDLP